MRSNDHFPDSGKPFRSARIGSPQCFVFANNRLTIRPTRGTYRMQNIVDDGVNLLSTGVFFAVGSKESIEAFPVGVTPTNAEGEYLTVSGFYTPNAVHYLSHASCVVEIDILDDQLIALWSPTGFDRIKIVKVGELPPRDTEVNDNHSGAFE